jgi:hypothetical protein
MEAGFLPISVDSRKAAFDLRGSGVHLKFEHTRSVVGAPIVRTPLGGGRHSPNYTAPVGRRLARTAVRDQQDEAKRDGRMHEGGNEGGTRGERKGGPRGVRESNVTSPLHFGLRFGMILDPPEVVARSAARRIAGERRLRLESRPRAQRAKLRRVRVRVRARRT